ncbi:hypothetical protein R6G67_001839 [Vibrio fluvialis]|nr:hypothetical protein [Vibrio fluvialis]
MAKDIVLPIDERYVDLFFAPVRSKKDIISLLMNTVKYITTEFKVDNGSSSFLHIVIDDMNRFIYESENKVFSIRSPFNMTMGDEGELVFYTSDIPIVDSAITSKTLLLVADEKFDSPDSMDFISLLEEVFEEDFEQYWLFVKNLLTFEDGYVRFDHDPDHVDGRLHPLTHLDICYTTASTYKIGTYRMPCVQYLRELLNTKTESLYLER